MARLYNAFDVLLHTSYREGFGLCLAPWTRIVTENGFRELRDISIGDRVLTHKGNFKPVTAIFKRNAPHLLEVKISNSPFPLYLTPEHPVYAVKRKGKVSLTKPEWIKASDLKKGDLVCFHLPVPEGYGTLTFDLAQIDDDLKYDQSWVWYDCGYSGITGELVKVKRYVKLDRRLARLIGLYIARGTLNSKTLSHTQFTFQARQIQTEIEDLVEEIFGLRVGRTSRNRMYFCSRVATKFLFRLCRRSGDIGIPREILFSPDIELLRECLLSIAPREESKRSLSFHIKSRQLAHDIFLASLRLGWKPACHLDRRGYFVVNVHKSLGRTHSNKIWIKDNICYSLVKSVRKIPYDSEVINLEVEGDNSFTTWSTSLHNCMYEAMSCGIPVIAHDFSAMREAIVEENGTRHGWLAKTAVYVDTPIGATSAIPDVYSIEKCIEKAYFKEKTRLRYARNARKFALKFDWDRIINEMWVPYLDKIIEENQPKTLKKRKLV